MLRGSQLSTESLIKLLKELGLVPHQNSKDHSEAYTEVFLVKSNGMLWSLRFFIDTRSGEGSLKIRRKSDGNEGMGTR